MKKVFSVILFAVLIASLLLTLTACPFFDFSNSENNSTTNNNGENNSSENNNSANETSNTIYIGEAVTNKKNVEFTVVEVYDTQEVGVLGTETENNYIVVKVKIHNKGSESWSQYPGDCKLTKDKSTYSYSNETFFLEDGMSGLTEINPDITKVMSIVFETPTKSTEEEYTITLSDSSFWSKDSVSIVLKERK